jgi:MFS family permease
MPKDLYFLMPSTDLLLNFFNTFGLKIGDKIGSRNSVLLSLFFEFVTLAILLYIPNYYMVLIAMGIFGIGIATNSLITIKNCWKYYPNVKGLVYGFNVGAAGISTSFFTPIADFWIINKDKEKTGPDGLYPKYIADRLPTYLYVLVGIFFVFGLISYLLTFNYEDDENSSQIEQLIGEEKKEEEKDSKKNEEKKDEIKIKRRKIPFKELFSLFCSKKNLQILVFIFGGPCKQITNLIKLFYCI